MHVSDVEAVSRAIQLKQRVRERLMSIPGVHGIGVGCRYRKGKRTEELAITVYVFKKKPLSACAPREIVPAEIEGIETDVIEMQIGSCCDDQARYRPLQAGTKINWTSTEHPQPNTTVTKPHDGSLGCFAKSRRNNKTMVLTAAHVVAGCGDPTPAVQAHRRIGQPDDSDDPSCCSKCWATVFGTVVDANQTHDVAMVQIDKCVDVNPQVKDIGPINGALTTAEINGLIGQTVQIRGYRTAEVRSGTVTAVDRDGINSCRDDPNQPAVTVNYYHRVIVEANGSANQPIADHGDSGAPVVAGGGKILGLLTGIEGSQKEFAVVCRIDDALNDFQANWDLEVVTVGNVAAAAAGGAVAAPHAFSALEPARPTVEALEPGSEDLRLLVNAREELLATSGGQRLSQLIARHTREVQGLIATRKRVAAVWQRVAGAEVLNAAVRALHSPARPFNEFVEGAPLSERIDAMTRVLTRYGSQSLVADLKLVSSLAGDLACKSYAETLDWLRNPASHRLEAALP